MRHGPCVVFVASRHFVAGHDEDPAKAQMGTPLERILKMGTAMLEAVKNFKPPSSDGKRFQIRLGQLCICFLDKHASHSPFDR